MTATATDHDRESDRQHDRESDRQHDRDIEFGHGHDLDHDVVTVGGGPAGCSAGVFTARYGLDTVVFDRGNAALRRCAYLSNYLGFPGGVDVDVFHDLMHAHADDAGCTRIPELVETVEAVETAEAVEAVDAVGTDEGSAGGDGDDTPGFVVQTAAGRRVTARYVVAAAWYDGSYLRGLDENAMFTEQEHHGEVEERFDPSYPDADGRTPVDGLYVAGPAGARSAQAIVAAGHGAHVARCLIEDHKRAMGYAGGVAPHYDWLRPASEFSGEWAERDRWREWFANEYGDDDAATIGDAASDDDDPPEIDEERFVALRERYLDRAYETRLTPDEVDDRADRGVRRFVEVVGPERVLDGIDDGTIASYVEAGLSAADEAEPTTADEAEPTSASEEGSAR